MTLANKLSGKKNNQVIDVHDVVSHVNPKIKLYSTALGDFIGDPNLICLCVFQFVL